MSGDNPLEERRLRSLDSHAIHDSDGLADLERLVRLAVHACGTPMAALSFAGRDGERCACAVGLGAAELGNHAPWGGQVVRSRRAQLQDHQRHDRPRQGRPAARPGGPAPGGQRQRSRHGGQAGRRRIRHPPGGPGFFRRGGGRARGRSGAAHPRGAGQLVQPGRRRAPHQAEHRPDPVRRRHARHHRAAQHRAAHHRAHQACGPGDVPGQGGRAQHLVLLRPEDPGGGAGALQPGIGTAPGPAAGRIPAALPAATGQRRTSHRRRGLAALAESRARHGVAGAVHSAGRGCRAAPATRRCPA
ncbi:MAG: basic proline-rich protein-like [Massilia sp.]|nr:basic proline-rich protein-like [Massilia sp.]